MVRGRIRAGKRVMVRVRKKVRKRARVSARVRRKFFSIRATKSTYSDLEIRGILKRRKKLVAEKKRFAMHWIV
jgi:hypothetical protein